MNQQNRILLNSSENKGEKIQTKKNIKTKRKCWSRLWAVCPQTLSTVPLLASLFKSLLRASMGSSYGERLDLFTENCAQ